jgi:hypothetical protein
MADGIGTGAKAAKSFITNHWLAFAVVAFVVVVATLAYDHKNPGKLTAKISTWPIVGSFFT